MNHTPVKTNLPINATNKNHPDLINLLKETIRSETRTEYKYSVVGALPISP